MYFSPRYRIGIGIFCIGFSAVFLLLDLRDPAFIGHPLLNLLCAACGGIAIGSGNEELSQRSGNKQSEEAT